VSRDRFVIGDVTIQAEMLGVEGDPAVLLVAGSAAPMAAWDDEFCARLTAGSRYVVRFDHRDTGGSTVSPTGGPAYGLGDLVADAVGVLDALNLQNAHLVGVSAGGWLAQLMALDHPDRVHSLTLVSSSPEIPGTGVAGLPGPSLRTRMELDDLASTDWGNSSAAVAALVSLARVRAGDGRPFDEAYAEYRALRTVDACTDLSAAMTHHGTVDHGNLWRERLGRVLAPALIIHGARDPIIPLAHAEALLRELPDAELLVLPVAGHELDSRDWPIVASAVLRHTMTTE
jgi:pimeloyl-ACP methyl ester carboxylesterase